MSEDDSKVPDEMILKICKVLAGRYRKQDQYEDLVSEGILACYECKAEGKQRKADYVGAARRAMNDLTNIKSKAVTVPNSWASRTVSRVLSEESDNTEELSGVTGETFILLMSAMSNMTEVVGETTCLTQDHALDYERREYNAHVLSVAITTLDQEEWQVIKMRYYEDMTQDDVAYLLGTNQKWVSRVEKRALEVLKSWLL